MSIITTTTTTTTTTTRKTTTRKPGGFVVYRGPSLIDGSPIVAVLTLKTNNAKTGDMAQLWIIREDMSPIEASQSGKDDAVCGACPLRGVATNGRAAGRSCYVNLGQAPSAVWKGVMRGIYPVATDVMARKALTGRAVRLGAYGDPLALPVSVLQTMVDASTGHTGYTHSWRMPHSAAYRHLVMASCETERGSIIAQQLGWRTFRVRRDVDSVMPNEIVCPASDEAGKRRECATCLACDGADRAGKRSVVIIGHGGIAVGSNVVKLLDSMAE